MSLLTKNYPVEITYALIASTAIIILGRSLITIEERDDVCDLIVGGLKEVDQHDNEDTFTLDVTWKSSTGYNITFTLSAMSLGLASLVGFSTQKR